MSPTKEEGFLQIARKALPLVLRVSPGLFVFVTSEDADAATPLSLCVFYPSGAAYGLSP